MVAKLAVPSFVAGAQDDLATADVYTETQDTPINSIPDDLSSSFDDSALLGLRGGKAMMDSADSALTDAMPSIDLGEVSSRMESVSGDVAGGLRDMSGAGAASLLGNIGANIPSIPLAATVDGVTANLPSTTSFTDASAIGGMINGLSGSPTAFSLSDPSAMVGTLTGVISAATSMGIPNAFGQVMKYSGISTSVAALDRQSITRIAAAVLPGVIQSADLHSLSSIADTMASGALKMLAPNVINNFGSAYRAPAGSTVRDYQSTYSTAMTTFPKIDPTWNQASRGDTSIPSILSLQGASSSMQKVIKVGALMSDDPTEKLQLLAGKYPPQSVDQCLSDAYPSVVLNTDYRSADKTLDPRMNSDDTMELDPTYAPMPMDFGDEQPESWVDPEDTSIYSNEDISYAGSDGVATDSLW